MGDWHILFTFVASPLATVHELSRELSRVAPVRLPILRALVVEPVVTRAALRVALALLPGSLLRRRATHVRRPRETGSASIPAPIQALGVRRRLHTARARTLPEGTLRASNPTSNTGSAADVLRTADTLTIWLVGSVWGSAGACGSSTARPTALAESGSGVWRIGLHEALDALPAVQLLAILVARHGTNAVRLTELAVVPVGIVIRGRVLLAIHTLAVRE